MMIVLCECNLGIESVEKLPPHLHYMAGWLPNKDHWDGGEWIAGALGANGIDLEQREFVHMDLRMERADLVNFLAPTEESA